MRSPGFDTLIHELNMTDEQLIARIRDAALLYGKFTLRSGKTSDYYLDKYLFETQPDILAALGERFATHIDDQIDRLAGAELGGIPLVTAASLAAGKPTVLIRNQKKDYGTAKRLEGKLEPGEKVLILEDVITSGGQAIEAARVIRDAAAHVVGVVAVIDREEGASEAMSAQGLRLTSLFTKSDLGIDQPSGRGV